MAADAERDELLVAMGALLLEQAGIDGDVADDEDDALAGILERVVGGASRQLIARSRDLLDESEGLTDLCGRLATRLNPKQRLDVVGMLWEVAYADGHVERMEGQLTRRVAELFELDPDAVEARRVAAEARKARE